MESPRPSAQPSEPIILRCACCGLPFARLEGDKLVIESRHKGEVHVNEISVGALEALGEVSSHAKKSYLPIQGDAERKPPVGVIL